jgi:hypothetical protein
MGANAQVTTNGGSGLAPTYADLASAITALNGAVISSPVVITLDPANPQTAPAGGYLITAQGAAVNTIIIDGGANVITASNALTAGALNDAIFKLQGADYVTLKDFVMQENAANTTTAAATNNMTEWGVALLYATTTNGAQNNTIKGNTISLNRTYQNTFGIYSNSTHAPAAPTTSATATTATGGNHNLKIYGNGIMNVNNGIVVVGPTAVADMNTGLDIGGTIPGTENTIGDYGTTGTFSAYVNVSGTVNGILVRNAIGFNVSYNTIASSIGGVTVGTLNGIQVAASSATPTGLTFTNTISNNTISLKPGATGIAMNGITYPSGSASATSTLNITNNDFNNFGHTTATASGTITFIATNGTDFVKNVNNNTFTNISVNTTGSITFIAHGASMILNATHTISNNAIVTAFAKTGAGGTITGLTSATSSVNGSNAIMTNNNFSNITVTGSTNITGITNSDGAGTSPNRTVTGNIFNNWTAGTGTIIGMSFTYIGATSTISNNTITNISGQGAITGLTIGSSFSGGNPLNVANNTVTNLVSSGAGGNVIGITCGNTSPIVNISGNAINTLSSTGASAVSGLVISGSNAAGTNVFKNKIYDLSGSNASSTVNGLLISGGALVTAYNNIIGDLRTPNASGATSVLNGINITGGTTVNAYNNTVFLNGVSSGAIFSSSAVYASTTPTVTLRNNIFVNNSTPSGAGLAVAYRRSSATLTSYAAASNNNLFFASTIFTDGTNTDATLAAYKARVASRDASSVSENPTFVSTTGSNSAFLHIDTAVATQIESGGATIATVTDDFDGDVRNATMPDIGADEFAGTLLDINGPSIAHTAVGSDCTGGTRTISATITDASGVPTVGAGLPMAYYAINAGAYTAATGVSMGAGVYNFSIGTGSVLGDVITYYFVAQDTAGTPNTSAFPAAGAAGFTVNPPAVATAPTTPFSYTVIVPLNGVYTVGAGGNYTTLTAAVADYNTKCMTGPVTFSLTDATYPSETFPITINQNADASAVNTLTIKPAVGIVPTISGSTITAIIKLNGADYVTIDGSNNGTTTRDLTITNTNTGTASVVIWNASASASNGASDNTFKNMIIVGNAPTTTVAGIVTGSTSGTLTIADTPNNRIVIKNNAISKVQVGIAMQGASAKDMLGEVTQNTIGSSVATDYIGKQGMFFSNSNGLLVNKNTVSNIVTGTALDPTGIIISAGVINATVEANTITNLAYTGTGGYGGHGIDVNTGNATSNITISNNMISQLKGDGWNSFTSDAICGIRLLSTTGGVKLYHNSINLGSGTFAGHASGTLSANLYVDTNVTGLDIRNNIFASNLVNSLAAAAKTYAIYSAATIAAFTTIDNNDYFITGTQAVLGNITATDRATLADMITGFGGNAASINADPAFTSTTDLHLTTTNDLGTPIATVTTDFDGDARTATPDMGADEFAPLSVNQFSEVLGFKAYPNPVSDVLTIEYTSDLTSVAVYNLLGQQVLAKNVNAANTQINMSELNAGTYLVKVEAGAVSKTLKVVKK